MADCPCCGLRADGGSARRRRGASFWALNGEMLKGYAAAADAAGVLAAQADFMERIQEDRRQRAEGGGEALYPPSGSEDGDGDGSGSGSEGGGRAGGRGGCGTFNPNRQQGRAGEMPPSGSDEEEEEEEEEDESDDEDDDGGVGAAPGADGDPGRG